MKTPVLTFHGAAGCVTGSCARLQAGDADILIDCGLFQGSKTLKELNYDPFPFDPAKIDAVLLTHAHIDHSGLLPKLRLAGFKGPILATAGAKALCAVMLPDAGAIQEMEVNALNVRRRRRGEEAIAPIYTAADATDTMALFRAVAYDTWTPIAPGVEARWWNAGHILGSASIEIALSGAGAAATRLLFSGDIGPGGRELAEDPQGPAGVDHLILESTYGGVERARLDPEKRRAALADKLRTAHARGGPLLIPAFAVERTQELLVDLLQLMERSEAPPGPIFLDSPLAIRATEVFLAHGRGENGNPYGALRESGWLRFTESASESRDIERFHGWHVIIAASGMCDAGRVRHHLKRLLWRPEASVMLVGYQPIGTLGRLLLEGREEVRIQGEPFRVRAHVSLFDLYSGHADGLGLTSWAQARSPVRGSVFLNHGEPESTRALQRRLVEAGFATERVVPVKLDNAYRLHTTTPEEISGAAARLPPEAVSRLDWHNARADFLSRLNKQLDAAESDAARKRMLDALAEALGGAVPR
ncbi:MAG: MBL fold metallo-hydrolase [Hyphomonadaceae bacterium]